MNSMNYFITIVLFSAFMGILDCNADSPGSQPKQIELTANGWMITIKSDGSAGIGRIRESNAIFSTASASAGAVDFEKVKKAVESDCAASDSAQFESPLQAAVRMIGQKSAVLKPVRDIGIWNRLTDQLKPKWTGVTLSSFKEAVQKNPLKLESP